MPRRRRIALAIAGVVVIVAIVLAFALIRPQDSRNYDARIEAYRRVSDDMHIVVFVALGYGDPILGYDLREDTDKVTVTVHARNRDFGPGIFKNLALYTGIPVIVTLQEPLRQRTVLSSTGAPAPEITCPDGTFSCFVGR